MFLLPPELREMIMQYIQANPSPNVPVVDVLKIVASLQQLKPAENIGEEATRPKAVNEGT